jgi:hypothetical protein
MREGRNGTVESLGLAAWKNLLLFEVDQDVYASETLLASAGL